MFHITIGSQAGWLDSLATVCLHTTNHPPTTSVSLTTCAIGLASTPFFLALGSEAVPLAANAALTGVVLLATCGPTVLLHAFTKPYIFSLRSLPPPRPPPGACVFRGVLDGTGLID